MTETDQDARTPTDQENALYDALNQGDQDAIDRMRDEALGIPAAPAEPGPGAPELEEPTPEPEPTPAEQFERDHTAAHAHYQKDHEAPEEDRQQNTADRVAEENTAAAEIQEGL